MSTKPFKVLVVTHTESLCSQRVLTGITDGITEAGSVEVRILKSSAAFTTENVRRALRGGVSGIIVSHPYNGEPSALLVERALSFIRQHAFEPIGAQDVANHLHASRQLVNLRFREQGKCSVLAAITTVRINEAKRLLTTTDTKISAITAAVGYTSEKYFKALFLRETGMTMSDWRRRHT